MKENKRYKVSILLTSVFIIAICGILYELLISTITTYFQGSSILHFSLVIGLFLSFMGVGAYLSKYLERNLLEWFIIFEIILGLVGGLSTFLLYTAFSLTPYFYGIAFCLIAVLGSLIGIEIPILTRIVRQYEDLKQSLADVLSFDYLGALIASVVFPLLLLPVLGTMRTAFVIGMLNLSVAIMNVWIFRQELKKHLRLLSISIGLMLLMTGGLIYSFQLISFFEQFLYRDEILLTRQSAYQRIVLTKWNNDVRLFIDGNLQFSSRDEYRYHEPLVHLPMALTQHPERILVLGGGDGLVARELFKHPEVSHIDLVDLDPEITKLGQEHPFFIQLNENAMNHPALSIYNQDAYKFVEESSDIYDLVIIDLPDPNNESLGKLYSVEFYGLLKKRMAAGGVVVTQSTSPYYAPKAFWCIHRSIEEVFKVAMPYTVNVPSFGQWGFNLAINFPDKLHRLPANSEELVEICLPKLNKRLFVENNGLSFRYLNPQSLAHLFSFDGDTQEVEVETNHLDNQLLVRYYEESWKNWR